MTPIVLELECPGLGYKEGPGGARWKSPLLPYEQAEEQLDIHLLYNHPLGRAETMNELAPMVSVGATDHQIEGEITPLFNASGLSERQPDHSLADLLSDQEEPNPWLPAALHTIEVKQSAKEAGELNEDMQTVLRYVNSVIGHNPNVTSWNKKML